MRNIIGIGETILDVIFKNDQPIAAVPGGSSFNAIVSLGRTAGTLYPDTNISMITETGDDHIGDIIIQFMEKNHISSDRVTRNKNMQSHVSMAFLDENNDAQYEFYKNHAQANLSEEQLKGLNFEADDLILFGSFFAINPVIRRYTHALFKQAHQAGAILYYDINFRKSHIADIPNTIEFLSENCRLSDIVRGSAEDFGYLFGTTDPQKIYDNHLKDLCPIFICTDGSRPTWVFTPDYTLCIPVEPIKTVSTIGAGDNFNAGFLFGLLQQGICKQQLMKLPQEQFSLLVSNALVFSKHVCQSIFNYVDEDFARTLKV